MDRKYLIPVATLSTLVGCGPAFVGDWELTHIRLTDGEVVDVRSDPEGTLVIDRRRDAELDASGKDAYGDSYSIEVRGSATEGEKRKVALAMAGRFVDGYGLGHDAEVDLDCEVERKLMTCGGRMDVEDYSYSLELEFEEV